MRMLLLLLVILFSVILSACADVFERPSLEDLGMVSTMAIDYIDENKMMVTASVPLASRSEEKKQVYSAISEIPTDAVKEMSTQSEKSLVLSQLRTVLFSEEFARRVGLREVVENLDRNPVVGSNVYLAVVKGRAEDILLGEYENKEDMILFLNDQLRPRRETAFHSFLTIHGFMYAVTNQVSDPNLPYLERIGNNLHVTKVALFKDDKMVSFLSQREGKMLRALLEGNKLPDMKFILGKKGGKEKDIIIVLSFVQVKRTISSNGNLQSPIISIKIRGKADIVSYTGVRDLLDQKQRVEVKNQINMEIQKLIIATITKLQAQDLESAGLAEALRKQYQGHWTKEIGRSALKKAKYMVSVDLGIVGYGTLK